MTLATGQVTGDAGSTVLGRLIGNNGGVIKDSFATGDVGASGADQLTVGGLVGDNSDKIKDSFATGDVTGGNKSTVGGLVGNNNSYRP